MSYWIVKSNYLGKVVYLQDSGMLVTENCLYHGDAPGLFGPRKSAFRFECKAHASGSTVGLLGPGRGAKVVYVKTKEQVKKPSRSAWVERAIVAEVSGMLVNPCLTALITYIRELEAFISDHGLGAKKGK